MVNILLAPLGFVNDHLDYKSILRSHRTRYGLQTSKNEQMNGHKNEHGNGDVNGHVNGDVKGHVNGHKAGNEYVQLAA